VRGDPGMTIDEKEGHIYLGFGVSDFRLSPEENAHNDLWLYNVNELKWSLLVPNDPFNYMNQPPVRYQCRMDFNAKYKIILLYGGDVLPDNQRPLYDTWIYNLEYNSWTIRDNNSMIPLFTGVSATLGDIFFIATGEMRYGTQVSCIDSQTGKKNNPVNDNYIIQFINEGSTYYQIYTRMNILSSMQSSYVRYKEILYVWGGFNFFCVSSSQQNNSDHRTIIRYFNNIWTFELPYKLY